MAYNRDSQMKISGIIMPCIREDKRQFYGSLSIVFFIVSCVHVFHSFFDGRRLQPSLALGALLSQISISPFFSFYRHLTPNCVFPF